jgi:hypothetical protein
MLLTSPTVYLVDPRGCAKVQADLSPTVVERSPYQLSFFYPSSHANTSDSTQQRGRYPVRVRCGPPSRRERIHDGTQLWASEVPDDLIALDDWNVLVSIAYGVEHAI